MVCKLAPACLLFRAQLPRALFRVLHYLPRLRSRGGGAPPPPALDRNDRARALPQRSALPLRPLHPPDDAHLDRDPGILPASLGEPAALSARKYAGRDRARDHALRGRYPEGTTPGSLRPHDLPRPEGHGSFRRQPPPRSEGGPRDGESYRFP